VTLKERLSALSWPDVGRAVLQRLEGTPGFGILLVASAKKHRLAARDSLLTVICGAIGVWLPILFRYGKDAQTTIDDSLAKVAARGDLFILVPSLLAPLFLLLAALKDNKRMRRHQVALFVFSAIAALLALLFWGRIDPNQTLDVWILRQSVFAFVSSLTLLYLYFLAADLPDTVLDKFKRSSTDLTTQVVERRKREGK